jgi:hypothetical protein
VKLSQISLVSLLYIYAWHFQRNPHASLTTCGPGQVGEKIMETLERVCLSMLCFIEIHVLCTFRDFIIKVLDF